MAAGVTPILPPRCVPQGLRQVLLHLLRKQRRPLLYRELNYKTKRKSIRTNDGEMYPNVSLLLVLLAPYPNTTITTAK